MSDQQNWRTEVDAVDYFGNQKKQLQVADRRPVIRKASDLVGPGIGAGAVRVVDWNDDLASFNGYYSSSRALNGPRPNTSGPNTGYDTNEYTAVVSNDDELGLVQVLYPLDKPGVRYERVRQRNKYDNNTFLPSSWVTIDPSVTAPTPMVQALGGKVTITVPTGSSTLTPPTLTRSSGNSGYFSTDAGGVWQINKPGLYLVDIEVSCGSTSNYEAFLLINGITYPQPMFGSFDAVQRKIEYVAVQAADLVSGPASVFARVNNKSGSSVSNGFSYTLRMVRIGSV